MNTRSDDREGYRFTDPDDLPPLVLERLRQTGKMLTNREARVGKLLAAGKGSDGIKAELNLTTGPYRRIRNSLHQKLHTKNKAGVAALFSTAAPAPNEFSALDEGDLKIIRLLAQDHKVVTVLNTFGISRTTFDYRMDKICSGFSVRNYTQLVALYAATHPDVSSKDIIATIPQQHRAIPGDAYVSLPTRVVERLKQLNRFLSPLQIAVGKHIAEGHTVDEAAQAMGHTAIQICGLRDRLYKNLDVSGQNEVAVLFSTATPNPELFAKLERPERLLLRHLAQGFSQTDIAQEWGCSNSTISSHGSKLMRQTNTHSYRRLLAIFVQTVPENKRVAFVETGIYGDQAARAVDTPTLPKRGRTPTAGMPHS